MLEAQLLGYYKPGRRQVYLSRSWGAVTLRASNPGVERHLEGLERHALVWATGRLMFGRTSQLPLCLARRVELVEAWDDERLTRAALQLAGPARAGSYDGHDRQWWAMRTDSPDGSPANYAISLDRKACGNRRPGVGTLGMLTGIIDTTEPCDWGRPRGDFSVVTVAAAPALGALGRWRAP